MIFQFLFCTESPRSVTPPEIRLIPETPNANSVSKSYSFDHVDGHDSEGSMSPQMRPRATSNMSEGKRKLALKFRKKRQESKADGQKGGSPSARSKEEDIDEIFKSYEEENNKNNSNNKEDFCGKKSFLFHF